MIKTHTVPKFNIRVLAGWKKWNDSHINLLNTIILVSAAIVFSAVSFATPYVYDDIVYHYCGIQEQSFFDLNPEKTALISSFTDIFQSLKIYFLSWSGRIIPAFVIYTIFWFGKVFFNIFNGIMASAVIYLVSRHICGRKQIKPSLLMTVASLFFLCAPSPGLTLFWANGAIIYLWTAVFYLLLLLPYRDFLEYGELQSASKWLAVYLLFPVGVIACNANENTALAILSVIILTVIFTKWKFHQIPFWMYSGLIGAITGCAILFGAPGVYQRVVYENYQNIPVISNIFILSAHLFHTIPCIFPTALILGVCTFFQMTETKRYLTSFYLLLILASGYSMIFSPYVPGRAVFGSFIFTLCLLGILLQQLDLKTRYKCALTAVLLSTAVTTMAFALRDINFTSRICNARIRAMEQAMQNGESRHWIFRPVCGISKYNALYKTDIIRENAEHFLNRHYAKKYKQLSVRTTPVPVIQGMNEYIFPEQE